MWNTISIASPQHFRYYHHVCSMMLLGRSDIPMKGFMRALSQGHLHVSPFFWFHGLGTYCYRQRWIFK